MSIVTARKINRGPLRTDAEARVLSGALPPNGGTISMQAMAHLFRLACSPGTEAAGLKLLHELQVHQVELDLQQEQLEANERDLCVSLQHYKSLFDAAPVGYLVIDAQHYVSDANEAAAWLLGIDRQDLVGRPVDSVLAPGSRPLLEDLRQQLRAGTTRASGVTASLDRGRGPIPLQVVASLSPAGDALLMALIAA